MKLQKKDIEPGAQWESISLRKAAGELRDGKYWREQETLSLLKEGKTLWTPWAHYRLAGLDSGLSGAESDDPQTLLEDCIPSFYPNISLELNKKSGEQKMRKRVDELIKEESIPASAAMKRLESELGENRQKPPAWYRARIAALDELVAHHKELKENAKEGSATFKKQEKMLRVLINGVFTPGYDQNELIEAKMKKDYSEQFTAWKADKAIEDEPLTFEELAKYNTFYALFPERILGENFFDTSRGFPIGVKGQEEEVKEALGEVPENEIPGEPELQPEPELTPAPVVISPVQNELKSMPVQPETLSPPMELELIQEFLALQDQKAEATNLKSLIEKIETAVRTGKITKASPFAYAINRIYKVLARHFNKMDDDGTGKVHFSPRTIGELKGILNGLSSKQPLANSSLGCVQEQEEWRSDRLPDSSHLQLSFEGKWKELFNQPTKGFSCMVYGKPKQGKSTLALDFAGYLAAHFGTVLWVELEEDIATTFKEKVDRLKVAHANLFVRNSLPDELSKYDYIFINSVSEGKFTPDAIRQLRKANSGKSFILIFHARKDGDYRGAQEHEHLVDVVVQVKKPWAEADGRFGHGKIEVRFE